MAECDIVIVGAGAAGMTAGLYTARAGMKVVLLEKATPGGQILLTEVIENFPGFPEGVKGEELAERIKTQAISSGLEIVREQVKEIIPLEPQETLNRYTVKTINIDYTTASIILACGAGPRRLGIDGEEKFTGRGVSYCATCDGPLFREREIIVVGGGNTAAEEALYLSKFARRVTLIHRRKRLRADKVYQERLKANAKIDFIWNAKVLEILGEERLSGVKIEDVNTGRKSKVSAAGVFIFVGLKPHTDFLKGLVRMDNQGFIITDTTLETSRKGIFACGDCRLRPLRQIVTACGEGAEAAEASRNYVERLKGTAYA